MLNLAWFWVLTESEISPVLITLCCHPQVEGLWQLSYLISLQDINIIQQVKTIIKAFIAIRAIRENMGRLVTILNLNLKGAMVSHCAFLVAHFFCRLLRCVLKKMRMVNPGRNTRNLNSSGCPANQYVKSFPFRFKLVSFEATDQYRQDKIGWASWIWEEVLFKINFNSFKDSEIGLEQSGYQSS